MAKEEKSYLYEGMYILSATLSDEAREKALDKITSAISERKGKVHKLFDQGRRKLAYEINRRKEGYYYILYFSLPSQAMREIWRLYRLDEDLIRFITLRVPAVPEKIEFKPLVQE